MISSARFQQASTLQASDFLLKLLDLLAFLAQLVVQGAHTVGHLLRDDAHQLARLVGRVQMFLNPQHGGFSGEGLHATHAAGNATLGHKGEGADFPGAPHVGSAAEFLAIAHAHHAHGLARISHRRRPLRPSATAAVEVFDVPSARRSPDEWLG